MTTKSSSPDDKRKATRAARVQAKIDALQKMLADAKKALPSAGQVADSTNGARFDSLTLALANDSRTMLADDKDRLAMADEVALAIRFVVEKYPDDMPLVRAWLTSRGIEWTDRGYVRR